MEKKEGTCGSDPGLGMLTSQEPAELQPSTDADKVMLGNREPASTVPKDAKPSTKPATGEWKRGFRFWMILIALSFTSLLTSLEATITSTALPSIIADLGGGDLYVWAANGYFLAM